MSGDGASFSKKPSTVQKLDVSVSGFRIEYSYCVTFQRMATQGRVLAKNLVYSDRLNGETISPFTCVSIDADPKWCFSYRKEEPEKAGLNIAALKKRYERQKAFNPNLESFSRRDPYTVQLLRRECHARQTAREKQARTRSVLAINLEEGASSSSSSSSSST